MPRVIDTNYIRELFETPEELRDTFASLENSQDDDAKYFSGGEDQNNLHDDLHVRNEEENRQAQVDVEVEISELNVEIPLTSQLQVQNVQPQAT
ncbi:unnamed protein product [Bemisia tabaci]|uniref:Uncharacterized protein n=1 Tax=Bemisia tabaci TaxID=7038 RepID=A0A9P0AF20_BEMTA|nr:unnamed protein product [Bemisia tabaci]